MQEDLFTFGEYLGTLLKKKKITVAELANSLSLKSRTSIHRLLSDSCSLDMINEFKKNLLLLDPLHLSPTEIEQIEQAIEVNRYGKDTIKARKLLLDVWNGRINGNEPYSLKVFGTNASRQDISIRELFRSYSAYAGLKWIIFNSIPHSVALELVDFITNMRNVPISIEQIMYLDDDALSSANALISLYKLLYYKNYSACFSTIRFPLNCIVIEKMLCDGTFATDILEINQNGNCSVLLNNPGNSLFLFYLNQFKALQANCQQIRQTYEKGSNIIDQITAASTFFKNLEETSNQVIVKQNLCYQVIPVNILQKLLAETGYLGFTEDHPKIQQLIRIYYERSHNYFSGKKEKIDVFTKRGLLDFSKTGTLSDHFYLFRPFTPKEVKETLEFMLDKFLTTPYKFYLLKNDYYIANLEISLSRDLIYFFDSSAGYGDDTTEAIITAKPFIKLIDDFIYNDLIPKHTLPLSDSVAFLKQLISSIEA